MNISSLDQVTDQLTFGGKAAQLGVALRAGLPVPMGYAVPYDLAHRLAKGDEEAFKNLKIALNNINTNLTVRSSAIDEDGATASYAGIYKTVLNITDDSSLLEAISLVLGSGKTAQAVAYRKKQGKESSSPVAVIIQQMIFADCSGVMFTRHPLTDNDERIIEACWGLGESIASGRLIPDLYTINRGATTIDIRLGSKETAIYPRQTGGTVEVRLDDQLINKACLTEARLKSLDLLASMCEQTFGKDLDIEWAISNEKLYLIQCRKITT